MKKSISFIISTIAPTVNLNYPANNAFLSNATAVNFNFTALNIL